MEEKIAMLIYIAFFGDFKSSFELITAKDFESSFNDIIEKLNTTDAEELKMMIVNNFLSNKEMLNWLNKAYLERR